MIVGQILSLFVLTACQDAKRLITEHYPQDFSLPEAKAEPAEFRLNLIATGLE